MTPPKLAERAYKVAEIAELKGVSIGFVRAAIKADGTDPAHPPLAAKKVGKEYRASASAVEAWFDALPDG